MTHSSTLIKRKAPGTQTVIVLPRDYLERERRRLIAKLRDIDQMLGNDPTIPERNNHR